MSHHLLPSLLLSLCLSPLCFSVFFFLQTYLSDHQHLSLCLPLFSSFFPLFISPLIFPLSVFFLSHLLSPSIRDRISLSFSPFHSHALSSPPLLSVSLSPLYPPLISQSLYLSLNLSLYSLISLALPLFFQSLPLSAFPLISVSLPHSSSFSLSLFLSLSLHTPLSSAAVKVKLAAHIHPSSIHQTGPPAASCDAPGCSCGFKPFSPPTPPPPPFLFFLFSSVSLCFFVAGEEIAHFLLSDVSWFVRGRSGSVCAVMAYQTPGFLFQPSVSLALHPSCPSFSSGVLLGPRTEDLGRSSSGSAFAPYSGSTTSSGFNAQLPYGGEPRAAATLGSFVVSVGSELRFWCTRRLEKRRSKVL